MGAKNDKETYITLSPEAVEAEIRVWESIKTCDFNQKSIIFNKTVDVDNVLYQLKKAKNDRKMVEIKAKSLYTYYYSDEERRQDQERERKRREEEEKKKSETKK